MKKIIYIEKEISDHVRTKFICSKFKDPEIIYIERYGEVFNKRNQNFRIQKSNPALIIAKKHKKLIHKTPENYGIGNKYNFYFSYMYNCLFDCKYCFLQGLYSSANHLIFINYEDFVKEIISLSKFYEHRKVTLFSGYDCDSLAYEPISYFMHYLIKKAHNFKNIDIEIRTKSTYIETFSRNIRDNIIIAYSFTPHKFSKKYEMGVPTVSKRILSISKLSKIGWKVGIRFDPIVIYDGWKDDYITLFNEIFKVIEVKKVHSISFGTLRFPRTIYKNIIKENLSETLFFNLEKKNNMYQSKQTKNIKDFCITSLKKFVDEKIIFFNN